jgi:hypothetical protein
MHPPFEFSIDGIDGEKIGGFGYGNFAILHRVYLVECWAGKALAQPAALPDRLRN